MTRTIRVETQPAYEVQVGAGLLLGVNQAVASYSAAAVLTDQAVGELYLDLLGPLAQGPVVRVEPGERSKSFACLETVLDELARADLDRNACLVAFGGGVIGDLGGLAASLYKRGIDFIQVPTTQLSQVDASVGGKTAVDLPSGKNLAGTFNQPRVVFADVTLLDTLTEDEYASGLGEVLKTAVISGRRDLTALETAAPAIRERDFETLVGVVERCVRTKARIVAEDPKEAGPRKQLNLGHTFAHAIEHLAGYGKVPHGIAVAAGIGAALEHAAQRDLLEDHALPRRVRALSRALGLPASIEELQERYELDLGEAALIESMRTDKKNRGGEIRLVLPRRAGHILVDIPFGGRSID